MSFPHTFYEVQHGTKFYEQKKYFCKIPMGVNINTKVFYHVTPCTWYPEDGSTRSLRNFGTYLIQGTVPCHAPENSNLQEIWYQIIFSSGFVTPLRIHKFSFFKDKSISVFTLHCQSWVGMSTGFVYRHVLIDTRIKKCFSVTCGGVCVCVCVCVCVRACARVCVCV
jgi:hypothetical protein